MIYYKQYIDYMTIIEEKHCEKEAISTYKI